tara:strand:- start:2682 stop:3212 length:531 start_codon:yes stop_codon:yes gene_type:complete
MANTTKIIRSANSSKHNFTPISNKLFTDETISLGTVGLVCYLVHLPENWIIYKEQVQKVMKKRGIGRDKFNKYWKEAKDNGYVTQQKFRTENGTYDYQYVISDNVLTTVGLSVGGLSVGGSTVGGKPVAITKNNVTKNKEEKNIKESNNLVLSTSQSEVVNSNTICSDSYFDKIFN